MFQVTVLPENRTVKTEKAENLLELLRREGFFVDAPCGGEGKYGKCRDNGAEYWHGERTVTYTACILF